MLVIFTMDSEFYVTMIGILNNLAFNDYVYDYISTKCISIGLEVKSMYVWDEYIPYWYDEYYDSDRTIPFGWRQYDDCLQ